MNSTIENGFAFDIISWEKGYHLLFRLEMEREFFKG
jgi:hypothetical protein